MIVKIVPSKHGSGTRGLCRYILDTKEAGDPASWRLSHYLLDGAHEGAKVGWAKATNCGTADLGFAVKALIAHNARNTRARTDLSLHLVASFPKGEQPSREQLEAIEQKLCDAIGLGEHPRISATHVNTSLHHLHICVSRVCPQTFRAASPSFSRYRLQEACAEQEIKHGLRRECHGRDAREAAANRQRRREEGQAQKDGSLGRPQLPGHPPRDPERDAFHRELAAATAAREKAMRELYARQLTYARELAAWHGERLQQERLLDLRGHLRRDGFQHLADRRRKDRAERLAREAEERKRVLAAHPLPSWEGFAAARAHEAARATEQVRTWPQQQIQVRPAPARGPQRREQGADLGR